MRFQKKEIESLGVNKKKMFKSSREQTERLVVAAKGIWDVQQDMDRILNELSTCTSLDQQHHLQKVLSKLCQIENNYREMERKARRQLDAIRKEQRIQDITGQMNVLYV